MHDVSSLRLVMCGTGPFAVPTFRALYATPHRVAGLVTQPARAARGKPPPANPMRREAEQRGTPVFDPESINTVESRALLAGLAPDLLVVCDYGQILSPETLAAAPLGGINLHGSLLPKYRGAAPINWALYHGETETGVTVIHMTPRIDAGPCLAQAATPIGPEETAVELERRLAELGAPLVCRTIDDLVSGRSATIAQDPNLATRARRLKKTDGLVDWSRSARAIQNQVRAFEPWPKTYTFWRRPAEPLRLILGRVRCLPENALPIGNAGTVLAATKNELVVAAGEGALAIEALQPSGKRMLTADEFLRGYPTKPGDTFGPE